MSKERKYSKSKMEVIRSYADKDIINVLNFIKDSNNLKALKVILDLYVPIDLNNNRNNQIKYGIKTKQAFVDGLKGCPKNVVKNKIDAFKKETEQRYTFIYRMYLEELFDSIEDLDNFSVEDILGEDAIDIFVELNMNKHCPKEYIENWYKYNPYIDINEDIERKIENLTFSLADIEKNKQIKEIENFRQEVNNQKTKINEIKNELKEIQEQLKEKEIENEGLKRENEEIEDRLTNYTSDNLELEIKDERQKQQIKELEIKNKELADKYNSLLKEYKLLSNKKSFSGDAEKMKNNLEQQIKEKQIRIGELEKENDDLKESNKDIIRLKDENTKLKGRETRNIRDLKSLILSDKDFQKNFKRVILENKPLCEFIVKNIPDLERDINEEVIKRRVLREEERDQKRVAVHKLDTKTIIKKPNVNYGDLEKTYNVFCTENGIEPMSNLWKRIQEETFFIFEDDSIVKLLKNGNYNIDIKRISVETDWHGVKDWFGEFIDGEFIAAKTYISDFYLNVKNNPDKLGILVFDKFNIIPPEIYIESYVSNIDNNGYSEIESMDTYVEYGHEFMTIEKIDNLKYFFIKRNDTDSFKIPTDLQKYELKGDL